ncbi:12319_t:CDS:2, partial [Entrophospora sp. SA101]
LNGRFTAYSLRIGDITATMNGTLSLSQIRAAGVGFGEGSTAKWMLLQRVFGKSLTKLEILVDIALIPSAGKTHRQKILRDGIPDYRGVEQFSAMVFLITKLLHF